MREILENPIAVREWRVLRRRAGDWRIWVGLKWPMDPIVWGAPVVVTYALGPYGLWAVLLLLRRLGFVPRGGLPLDPFFMLALVLWCYVVTISLVLGATAVSHEREQQTWAPIQVTPLTGQERAMGLLWGRVGPVWIGFAVAAAFWWPAPSAASEWRAPGTWPALTPGVLAMGTGLTFCFSVLAGQIGLLASARSRRTVAAVVLAALWLTQALIPFVLMGVAAVDYGFIFGQDEYGRPVEIGWLPPAYGLVIFAWLFLFLCRTVWRRLVTTTVGQEREQ